MPAFARIRLQPLCRLGICVLSLCLLNGCAALAVSLAGAGAGAGISHQMNGVASRTFSEPFDKVGTAVLIASRKLLLEVDSVETIDDGQITRARVGNLDVAMELETLSPSMTRISVTAKKDFFRADAATAKEIVSQIEVALQSAELAAAMSNPRASNASYLNRDTPARNPKSGARAAPRNTI